MTSLLSYERSGGLRPADDERLVVEGDGAYAVVRTVGGQRVGRFAGTLDAAQLTGLRVAVSAVDADLSMPADLDGARESYVVAGGTANVGDHARPEGAWGDVVALVRPLLDTLSAVGHQAGLMVKANPGAVQLLAVGDEPFEVDTGGIELTVVAARADGGTAERYDAPAGSPSLAAASPGWHHVVELPKRFDIPPGGYLRVTVVVPVRRAGRTTPHRLFVALPG